MSIDTEIITEDHSASPIAVRLDDLVTHGVGSAIHNYTGSPENMFKFTTICTGSQVKPGADFVGEVILVKYWYLYGVQFEAADGELSSGIRTVLVSDDLQAFGFGSAGVAASLLRFVQAYGQGPYEPSEPLRITQTTTRKGRRFFRLEPENLDLTE